MRRKAWACVNFVLQLRLEDEGEQEERTAEVLERCAHVAVRRTWRQRRFVKYTCEDFERPWFKAVASGPDSLVCRHSFAGGLCARSDSVQNVCSLRGFLWFARRAEGGLRIGRARATADVRKPKKLQ